MKVKTIFTIAAFLMTLAVVLGQEVVQPPVAAQQGSAVDVQGVRDYLLGPGDVVDVRVFGQPDMNTIAEVDSEGNLSSLPFLDPIPAKCRTEKQVQKDIAAAYAKYLKNAQVSVRITERKSRPPATLFGAVRAPSQVLMLRTVRLNELISKGGGFTERASGTIQILHTEPIMCPGPGEEADAAPIDALKVPMSVIKIGDLLANKPGANPIIRPGDYISVTEAEPVYITGSVGAPQGIYMRDQLTLGVALAMVGGVKKEAKQGDVIISRLKNGTERETIHVDYAAIRKNQKPDILLKAYDVIEVPEASPFSGGRLAATLLSGFTQAVSSAGNMLPMRVLY